MFIRFARVVLCTLAIGSVTASVAAEEANTAATEEATYPARCLLQIKGVKYIAGTCKFRPIGEGNFVLQGGDYFTYVFIEDDPNMAVAHWNADPLATHAHSPLGKLARNGACWVSETVKICAWKLDK